jgi:hypothetical protein
MTGMYADNDGRFPDETPVIDWLRLQLDEDEQKASSASGEQWTNGLATTIHPDTTVYRTVRRVGGGAHVHVTGSILAADAEHIARHDPARVLREVEALRAIIDLHEPREYVTYLKHVTYWQCGYCADLCHSRSGLGCDSPDAPWPCETAELLEADQPVGSGVVQPVEERQPE